MPSIISAFAGPGPVAGRRHSPGLRGSWPEVASVAGGRPVVCFKKTGRGPHGVALAGTDAMSALATLGYVIAAAVGLLSGVAAVTVFWMILTEPLRLAQLLTGWL